jgi:diacylglycerol kinase (ATP)
LSGEARRAIVLLNPAAGRGRAAARLKDWRRLAGVEVVTAASGAEMERQAREAVAGGCQRVIAAGGDGAVHHVLNGVAGTSAALGIIPCGSGNDFARELGLPMDLAAAAAMAVEGAPRAIDLGRIDPPGRYFGCIASFGLDSYANRLANEYRGPLRGTALYVYALLRALVAYRTPWVTAGEFRGPAILLAAANTPSYGGGMRIAPGADPADGLLDVVVVRDMSRLKLLWCFPEVFRGAHLGRPEVTVTRLPRLRVEADRPLEIFADGEFVGYTPVQVSVLPGGVKVVTAPSAP